MPLTPDLPAEGYTFLRADGRIHFRATLRFARAERARDRNAEAVATRWGIPPRTRLQAIESLRDTLNALVGREQDMFAEDQAAAARFAAEPVSREPLPVDWRDVADSFEQVRDNHRSAA